MQIRCIMDYDTGKRIPYYCISNICSIPRANHTLQDKIHAIKTASACLLKPYDSTDYRVLINRN